MVTWKICLFLKNRKQQVRKSSFASRRNKPYLDAFLQISASSLAHQVPFFQLHDCMLRNMFGGAKKNVVFDALHWDEVLRECKKGLLSSNKSPYYTGCQGEENFLTAAAHHPMGWNCGDNSQPKSHCSVQIKRRIDIDTTHIWRRIFQGEICSFCSIHCDLRRIYIKVLVPKPFAMHIFRHKRKLHKI